MSSDRDRFQELGENYRRRCGIDGTAGDAQDIPHPYRHNTEYGVCLACGLTLRSPVHVSETGFRWH